MFGLNRKPEDAPDAPEGIKQPGACCGAQESCGENEPARDMTLDEYVGVLPDGHPAKAELAELRMASHTELTEQAIEDTAKAAATKATEDASPAVPDPAPAPEAAKPPAEETTNERRARLAREAQAKSDAGAAGVDKPGESA